MEGLPIDLRLTELVGRRPLNDERTFAKGTKADARIRHDAITRFDDWLRV